MDHSPPGFSVHGILQARILVAMPSQGIFQTQGSNPIEPVSLMSPALGSLPLVPPGKPFLICENESVTRSVQFSCSVMSDSLRPQWTAAHQASLSITNSQSLFMSIESIHRVSDAIQPSHPLSSPSPPAFNTSQHQGLFQRVSSSHQVAKVLELQLQYQFFQ